MRGKISVGQKVYVTQNTYQHRHPLSQKQEVLEVWVVVKIGRSWIYVARPGMEGHQHLRRRYSIETREIDEGSSVLYVDPNDYYDEVDRSRALHTILNELKDVRTQRMVSLDSLNEAIRVLGINHYVPCDRTLQKEETQ